MKKIFIHFCLLSSFCFFYRVAIAQQNEDYKHFISYNGNVVSYLYENFYLAKANYIGKPLKDLLNKLEVPVSYSIPTTIYSGGPDVIYYGCKKISLFFTTKKI